MISAAAGGNRRRPTSLARAGSFLSSRWVRTIARTAAATRSGSRAISASVVASAANVYWPAAGGPSPRRTSAMTFPTPRRTAVSLPSALAQNPSTRRRSSASAATTPNDAPASSAPGTGPIVMPSRAGSIALGEQAAKRAIRSGGGADAEPFDGADVAAARRDIRANDQQPRRALRQRDDELRAFPL